MTGRMFRFGAYQLDGDRGILLRDGQSTGLQSQPARLLALLVEHAGAPVTREAIRAALWPDTTVAYDQSINYCIRQIRIALGPDAAFVETIPRRGYRFSGAVKPRSNGWRVPRPPQHGRASLDRTLKRLAALAALGLIFAGGFSAGVVARERPVGQFVYVHLVHPDRCPYMRFLIPTHRAS